MEPTPQALGALSFVVPQFRRILVGIDRRGDRRRFDRLVYPSRSEASAGRSAPARGGRTSSGWRCAAAIAAELRALQEDCFDPLEKKLKERDETYPIVEELTYKNRPPLKVTRTEQNRITVFQSNADMIGRINDDELRERIVRVYGLT